MTHLCKVMQSIAALYAHFKITIIRDVAQSGSALARGASGRRFKSSHPDHIKKGVTVFRNSFVAQKV